MTQKQLFKISSGLIAISVLMSAYLFQNPTGHSFLAHWILPVMSLICLIILIGAERGPKPIHQERGFGAILIGVPVLAILFQLHDLSVDVPALSVFENELVPLWGFHIFLALVGNYTTTSKSLLTGLPTPWNMRSDLSWRKSHRFIGFGIVFITMISAVNMMVTGAYSDVLLGTCLFGLFLSFVIYSWWVWRHDANRGPLHGRS